MADLALKIPQLVGATGACCDAGAAILGDRFPDQSGHVAPHFWLLRPIGASAPVAALFAILTKVGLYAVLRLWTLLFGRGRRSAWFGGVLFYRSRVADLGAIGMLASQQVSRLAGFSMLLSSGTLLAAIGFGHSGGLGPRSTICWSRPSRQHILPAHRADRAFAQPSSASAVRCGGRCAIPGRGATVPMTGTSTTKR